MIQETPCRGLSKTAFCFEIFDYYKSNHGKTIFKNAPKEYAHIMVITSLIFDQFQKSWNQKLKV